MGRVIWVTLGQTCVGIGTVAVLLENWPNLVLQDQCSIAIPNTDTEPLTEQFY